MTNSNPLFELRSVTKKFNTVEALRGIDLAVHENEIVGLLGDNGAGKSTLIKIITGVHEPTTGELYWKGEKLNHYDVNMARNFGIETVFQDRALCEQHSIWRNIYMGREIKDRLGFLKVKEMKERTADLMKNTMGFTSDAVQPDNIVGFMSGGERQGVAISRALAFDANLIILDEPTTGLSLAETQKVLGFIKKIKNEGKSSIFISHNIYHVYPVVDRIVLIDRGRVAYNYRKDEVSLDDLIHKMYEVAGHELTDDMPSAGAGGA